MHIIISNTLNQLQSFWQLFFVTSSLPILAFLAVFLRRDFLRGRLKNLVLFFGFLLLSYSVYEALKEHASEFGPKEILFSLSAALATYFVLARFSHHHEKESNIKGLAIGEFIHGLMDGVVIGVAYLASPILGYATALGIIVHELPKIVGTIFVIRSMTKSLYETIKYSLISQLGVPLSAIFIFATGVSVNDSLRESIELAALSTLSVIILRVLYYSYKHRGHDHEY